MGSVIRLSVRSKTMTNTLASATFIDRSIGAMYVILYTLAGIDHDNRMSVRVRECI